MEQKTTALLFKLLATAIHGRHLTDEEKSQLSDSTLSSLLSLSQKHDVGHLVGWSLHKNGLADKSSPLYAKLHQLQILAVFRYEGLHREYRKLCAALETAQIPFLPLKGSVLRKYYPEPWMRTSCDIDVLVHEDDLDRAVTCLTETCGYRTEKKSSHDVSLYSPGGQHVELHYDLVEDGRASAARQILQTIWSCASVQTGHACRHQLSDEMFYFYHIAHMAKHFENGGCGIRPFIDLWILDHLPDFCPEKRDALLKQGGLLQFANAARRLSKVWLDGAKHDPITRQTEIFLLRGGMYGNSENRITLQQQKKGGAVKFALSRAFLPYDVIKFHYPILQKHPWLTPVMEVRRWGKLLFCGHTRRVTRELRFSQSLSKDTANEALQLLQDLGLV